MLRRDGVSAVEMNAAQGKPSCKTKMIVYYKTAAKILRQLVQKSFYILLLLLRLAYVHQVYLAAIEQGGAVPET